MQTADGLLLGKVALVPVDALSGSSQASGDQLVTLRLRHTPSGSQLAIEQDSEELHRLSLTADEVRGLSGSVGRADGRAALLLPPP